MRLRLTTAAVLAGLALALPAGATAPGPGSVAITYASQKLHLRGVQSLIVLRSKIDRRWTLVDGFYQKPGKVGLWALWLNQRSGRWVVVFGGADKTATAPASKVPCDIWPAFSEPACQPG